MGARERPLERLRRALTAVGSEAGRWTEGEALTGLWEGEANLLLARMQVGYPTLAAALSLVLPGQFIATSGALVWLLGREACYLLDVRAFEAARCCRRVAEELGCAVRSWTAGGVARALLTWTGCRQPHRRGQDGWLKALPWAYQAVTPGKVREATLWDLEAAYWNALCRLPSPHVDWLTDRLHAEPLAEPSRSRWPALLAGVGRCKPLRLCLVGCMRGGGVGGVTYSHGRRLAPRRARGPLYTAALTVARAVYELTALQAEAGGALYANTDAVILPEHSLPLVWRRYGYPHRAVAQGAADIIHVGAYQVGQRVTVPYRQGAVYPIPPPRCPLPSKLSLTYWH